MDSHSRWNWRVLLLGALGLLLLALGLLLLGPFSRFMSVTPLNIGLNPVGGSARSGLESTFNYAEALQKAIYFYDAQRSGVLPYRGKEPGDNRVEWRGDSGLTDGADAGIDLTGGFYDAGDHVKFAFPMAGSLTLLAWGALAYQDGFLDSDQYDHLLENLRWGTDWILKAHPSSEVFYGQVGTGSVDHAWWGPAEVMPMNRPSYKLSASCPGSDLAGEAAAALAAASLVFKAEDATYASTLLSHAKQLYAFADTRRGKYSDCITDAASFYASWSGYTDELVWGALWLYYATNDKTYLDKARSLFTSISGAYKWTHSWDDKSYGSFVLLARLSGDSSARTSAERWLDYWTTGYGGARVTYTPGGLAYLSEWGSLRYAANTAFLAFIYADWLASSGGDSSKISRYRDFAARQIRYMLGENPSARSYVVGFGAHPPQNPHHRTSHGSWLDSITEPAQQRHVLYGALVGGPDGSDQYVDDRSDYFANEVALDYNAAFVGALASLARQYPGTPQADFPPKESRDDDEFYVKAALTASGTNFSEIRAIAVNKSAWPATRLDRLALRYYFTLEPGVAPSSLSVTSAYSQCRPPTGPHLLEDSVYYIEADCSGSPVYPGGSSVYAREVQLRITSSTAWDASNDWSAQGLKSGSPEKTARVALFEDGRLIWGSLPDGSSQPEEGCLDAPESDPAPQTDSDSGGETSEADPEGGTADAPPAACSVSYTFQSDWSSGFVADVRLVNQSVNPLNGWTLSWRFSGNQKITNLWNGKLNQTGANVEVEDADWNAAVASGASASFGFQAEYSGQNSIPGSFSLNGVQCSTVQPVAGGTRNAVRSARAQRLTATVPIRRSVRLSQDDASAPCGDPEPTSEPTPPAPTPLPEEEVPGCSARLPALLLR